MNISLLLIQEQFTEALGWTLLHSLWQGLIIAAVLAFAIRLVRGKSPQLIYQLCCFSLLALVSWMVFTFLNHLHWPVEEGFGFVPFVDNEMVVQDVSIESALTWQENISIFFQSFIQSYAGILVKLWLLGVVLFGLKWLTSLYYTYSLKNQKVSRVTAIWQKRVDHFSRKLDIRKRVEILESTKIDVPMVIGCLKPVILIPTSVFSGFSPEQIESIIVHELAHVKSNDFLVGLILSAMEVILFYHPIYWWISKIIIAEREKRCDDVVLEECGNPLLYAQTLFSIAKQNQERSLAPSLQGQKNQLLERIKRVCTSKNNNMNTNNSKTGIALSLLFVMAVMVVAKVPLETMEYAELIAETAIENVSEVVDDNLLESEKISENNKEKTEGNIENAINETEFGLASADIVFGSNQEADGIGSTDLDNDRVLVFTTKVDADGNIIAEKKYADGRVQKFSYKKGEAKVYIDNKLLEYGNHTLTLEEKSEILIVGTMKIWEEEAGEEETGDQGGVLGKFWQNRIISAEMDKKIKLIEMEREENLAREEETLARENTYSPKARFLLDTPERRAEIEELHKERRAAIEKERAARGSMENGVWVNNQRGIAQRDTSKEGRAELEARVKKLEEELHAVKKERDEVQRESEEVKRRYVMKQATKEDLEAAVIGKSELERAHRKMEKEMLKLEENRKEYEEKMEKVHEEQMLEHEKAMERHEKEMEEHHRNMEKHHKEMERVHEENEKFHKRLSTELQSDGLIRNKNKFKFELTDKELKVNKKKVSSELHKKYLKIYEKQHKATLRGDQNVSIQVN